MNAIEVRDLRFSYADGTEALRGVNLCVADGECVGLIGPNGAGKSTLLWHLNGLLPENASKSNAVRVFGQEVTAAHLDTIRQRVGLVFQDPDDQIFCPTVFEDVAYGPEQMGLSREEIAGRVRESLEKVGLAGFEKRAPHHLSGGERRRVCLAGILACQSRVLVMDEPTSDLDPRGRREFKQLLGQLAVTKIIATHDLELVAEICTRAIVLDGGVVVADGPAVEVMANESLMLEHGLEKPHILQHYHPHR
ncbi:MAG: energy-coupling factor ABC transporter ATP-binding protein [Bacillota bacterium]